ncbi:MAG: formate dehydrogenase subunit alpha [Acidimicrobiales bacterium]|nr:MAG: formate dehydrogenase subunit alpha [Acidimicrobiales bacterium]
MFGAGGGTCSYEEIEETDVILLWGSNAREAHPIFFHHLLKGIDNGARMFAVDPRRSSSAKFADVWLGLDVGSDIAMANAVGREIIAAGLHDERFIAHSTDGFEAYKAHVESYTLDEAERLTGVPAAAIRDMAHAYATAETAQILWTLGITEHHNAVENVLSLCNLALLTGHVGRWGSGLVPLRGQNNVQGGGDMGALPDKFPGFQDIGDPAVQAKFEATYGTALPDRPGKHLTLMFEAMDEGSIKGVYVIGENPADSEADVAHARALLSGLDLLVVQDIFLTRTAELADVVLPASVGWAECDGTVTSSERRVQRVRAAVSPPGECRHDHEILGDLATRLGVDWGTPSPEDLWDELRSLSPLHAGMSYERLESERGLQWPCPDLDHPGSPFLHGWLHEGDLGGRGPAPFSITDFEGPKEQLTDAFPLRLTTGRALDSYNTGVQSNAFASPIRYGDEIDVNPADAARLGVVDGERVLVSSPRGAVEMHVRVQVDLPIGLTFTTFHFPELVDINTLTNDEWDPRSGTAEFKAASIRIEKLAAAADG